MSTEVRTFRRALVAAGAAGAAALAATATPGAADTQQAGQSGTSGQPAQNSPPVASLKPRHRRVRVGKKLLLDASRSHDADGRIVYYLWDLNGDGVFERNTGSRPRVRHAFKKPGKVRVAVVVVDDKGAYATTSVRVRAISLTGGARGSYHPGAPAQVPAPAPAHPAVRDARLRAATTNRPKKLRPAKASTTSSSSAPALHAASSGGVTISDYKFAPKSITVKVGDTVTWTNNGPSTHSATANDGSFDTGLLKKGSSGSFRFTKAGTFGYHCTPHPTIMKATVTVTGSGGSSSPSGSSGSGSGSGGSSGGSGSSSHSSNGSSLPHTGLEIASVVLAGLALLGLGAALRRRLARR